MNYVAFIEKPDTIVYEFSEPDAEGYQSQSNALTTIPTVLDEDGQIAKQETTQALAKAGWTPVSDDETTRYVGTDYGYTLEVERV